MTLLEKQKLTHDMEAQDKIVIMDGEIHRTEKTYINDIEYIRKGTLLEWAKARKAELLSGESFVSGERKMLKEIIDKLNSL